MNEIIKTAKENFKNCSWWGGGGDALPARHVAPLFAEINRLRNESKSLRLDLGLVKISLDHKTTLLDSCEKALIKRDEEAVELRKSTENQHKALVERVKACGFESITDMSVKTQTYRDGIAVMTHAIKEARSLPESRQDEISAILLGALTITEICHD